MKHVITSLMLLTALIASAGPGIASGDRLPPFVIKDQYDREARMNSNLRLMLFSRDMNANKLVKEALMDKPVGMFTSGRAIYVIDVSGMPGFITDHFAVPKMKKYGYSVYLDRDGALTTNLPSRKRQVTIIYLDNLTVNSIKYADNSAALSTAIAEARVE